MDNRVELSVIIPVYNQADNIRFCVKKLINKERAIIKKNMEIILIDDGSEDDSAKECQLLSKHYKQVIFFHQENKGVSSARNRGIKEAKGKYIFFLDADDELAPGTLGKVKAFFDLVEDKTDLVTYPIDTIVDGKTLKPHFRYEYLKKTGIYDLESMPYIGQTTMNIAVKNRFGENILFDEKQTFSEDQKYCCEVLKDKLKMGFCNRGRYIYHRNDSSSSGQLSGACFIFEQCTTMFETIFSWYPDRVPLAFQGLFVNDFYWKLCSNMLFPHHYNDREYDIAVNRLKCLLDRCDSEIILNHPNIDFFEKYYLLRLKRESGISWKIFGGGFGLYYKNIKIVFEDSIEIVITKCKVIDEKVRIQGFLKSVFFQFYPKEPELIAVENDGIINRALKIRASTHNYYLSHEETQRFFAFNYECNPEKVFNVKFVMRLEYEWFPTHYYFMPLVAFSHELNKYSFSMNNVKIEIDHENLIHISKVDNTREEIYLYYDCVGVSKDNGLIKFLSDRQLNDFKKRYYVVSDNEQWNYLPDKKEGVVFGSKSHKALFLKCNRVYTAYIEEKNVIPFLEDVYAHYADKFAFEVIYLQHGVLHVDMPWKYSSEKLLADKIVISTEMEARLLKKYGYDEDSLIKTGMPRFDKTIVRNPDSKRILFAPSWRSYLIGSYNNQKWESMGKRFKSSSYYSGLISFFNNETLCKTLELYDFEMDVKLHPIFQCYRGYFNNLPPRVNLINQVENIGNYKIFITDFSSFMYDFDKIGTPILFYLPDCNEFRCGMNGYREIVDEGYWEKTVTSSEELIQNIVLELQRVNG